MSFDAISTIAKAEADARAAVADAEAQARQMVLDAENSGKAAIEDAVKNARAKREDLARETESRIAAAGAAADKEAEQEMQALREQAMGRLDEAAKLVVERIVKG